MRVGVGGIGDDPEADLESPLRVIVDDLIDHLMDNLDATLWFKHIPQPVEAGQAELQLLPVVRVHRTEQFLEGGGFLRLAADLGDDLCL